MGEWYDKVSVDPDDLLPLVECIDFFNKELDTARYEVNITGSLEKASASLPGIVEHRFSQLQEIEAILELLNIRFKQVKGKVFRRYLEKYERDLSSRDAEKFADTDDEVIQIAMLVNQIALVRNQYLAIHKALELKGFQISNITKLRCAGLEDVEIRPIYISRKKNYSLPDKDATNID